MDEEEYIDEQENWLSYYNVMHGTRVGIVDTADSYTDGWTNGWVEEMSEAVGEEGIVLSEDGSNGIYVEVEALSDTWYFPFFVLRVLDSSPEKEEEPPPEPFEVPDHV